MTSVPVIDGRLLSVEDVAELLGVPPKSVYVWRAKGEGPPAAKIGRYLRFRRQDVDAWIARQVAGPETPDLDAVADSVRTGGHRPRRGTAGTRPPPGQTPRRSPAGVP